MLTCKQTDQHDHPRGAGNINTCITMCLLCTKRVYISTRLECLQGNLEM